MGLETLLCRVVQADDVEAGFMSLSENDDRENVNPMERAALLQNLISEYGLKQKDIAKKLHRKESTISKLLAVHADEVLREAIASGKVDFTSAFELLSKMRREEKQADRLLTNEERRTFVDESLGVSAHKIREGRTNRSPDDAGRLR